MKIRRLLMSALLPMTCLCAAAQQGEDNTPAKGDFTVAATLGYNSYTEATALPGNLTDYEASAFATDWSKKKLTVGFEAGYFVSEKWKLSLGGGINFTHNPGYADKPGTMTLGMSGEDMVGEIPSYRAVASQYSCTYNVAAGLDRYFSTSVKNLMWYGGVRVGMAYSLNEQKYDEWTAMGKSVGESWSLRGALTIGADYYRDEGYVCWSIGRSVCLHLQHDFLPSSGRTGTSERR